MAAGLWLAACSSGSANDTQSLGSAPATRDSGATDDSDTAVDSGATADSAPQPPVPVNYAAAKAYIGTYASKSAFRTIEGAGNFGQLSVLTTLFGTANISDDPANSRVVVSAAGCHLTQTAVGTGALAGAQLTAPDVIPQTTKVPDAQLLVSTQGTTISWQNPLTQVGVGWHPASDSDALPTDKTDPRIFDQDSDGNPGVTILLSGPMTAQLYIVEWQRYSFQGTVSADGSFSGQNFDTSQQQVLGSDNVLLAAATITRQDDPNTSDNVVRIVKTPTLLSCADLIAQSGTLFN